MTRRKDFATAVREGRRVARRTLVVHLARSGAPELPARVGFVVGRPVGGAVVRHRVQRQLRHLMRSRLAALPAGALLVVRALPTAAGAGSAALNDDLQRALRRLAAADPAPDARTAARRAPAHLGGR
jgi:ribonuclease P protein component